MATDDNARPGLASGTGGEQAEAKVPKRSDKKRRRVEIAGGPGWSVVGWVPVDEAAEAG